MNLAYTEMRSILSRINWDSEMRLSGESRRWIEFQEARVVWEKPASKVY
ncbi:cytochrome P450 monooxygenase [Colletotrichum paranaense]|uniref:Cytochrome P450 monooxygenase n=1 Tax=Colletotrichum paranaense TaxID=1914294 RepID=A0ABQ9SR35_9PEZI|nr:cytochrome P450 monooxygenase [Colletotrichum paranaense]XP_060395684.1 cytochrome P450 monooxygenase [Colletotrichum abscissum]KAK1488370.1 cytochrome P450 monooxygenase [Colletotrichum abscissum]KAK1541979.1 cytochrome P450 monooxygenase [Colletotrichum paranaense]